MREASDAPRHTVVLDWDGTLVPAEWPGQPTELMPGALQSMFAMHRSGLALIVNSARLNPYDPFTSLERPPALVEAERRYIRDVLDSKGLPFINIWTLPGKPSGSLYVDDKAVRYTGRPGSWRAVTEKVFAILGKEEPVFPAFNLEVHE